MSAIPNLQQAAQAMNTAQTGAASSLDALSKSAGLDPGVSATGSP
jgi:hypothetical protein